MANGQTGNVLRQLVTDMEVLEGQVLETLDRTSEGVKENGTVATAVGRFRAMAQAQRQALRARLLQIGGTDPGSGETIHPGSRVEDSKEKPETVSGALQTLYGLFHEAAFGYSVLHLVAHRFYDSKGEGNTADLAEKHFRSYAEAGEAINELIADLVVWELNQVGQECQCKCPSCGLGICLCSPHGTNTASDIRREALPAVAGRGGIRVRLPRAKSAADRVGLRLGDIVIAIDDHGIPDEGWDSIAILQDSVGKHQSGEGIRLRVRRASGDLEEISVTRP